MGPSSRSTQRKEGRNIRFLNTKVSGQPFRFNPASQTGLHAIEKCCTDIFRSCFRHINYTAARKRFFFNVSHSRGLCVAPLQEKDLLRMHVSASIARHKLIHDRLLVCIYSSTEPTGAWGYFDAWRIAKPKIDAAKIAVRRRRSGACWQFETREPGSEEVPGDVQI